jgi:hypothetical protein
VAVWIAFMDRRVEPLGPSTLSAYAIAAPRVELAATWTRVFEAPLLTEAQNLSNSAQSGLRFLVACLTVRPPAAGTPAMMGESGPPPVQ